MTKFETIGVNYQYDANNKFQAEKSFMISCDCCARKGMRIDCDRCAIAHTHSLVMAYFDDREKRNTKTVRN